MKPLREALLLAAAALAPAVLAVAFHPDLADRRTAGLELGEVRLAQVRDWHTEVVWLDARSPEEFAAGHIPGALPFDPARFDQDLGAVLAAWIPGRPIVVYCGSRSCDVSREVSARLRAAGLEPVHHLHGGWEAWVAAAGP